MTDDDKSPGIFIGAMLRDLRDRIEKLEQRDRETTVTYTPNVAPPVSGYELLQRALGEVDDSTPADGRDGDGGEPVRDVDTRDDQASGGRNPRHVSLGPWGGDPHPSANLERIVDLLEDLRDLAFAALDGERVIEASHDEADLGHGSSSPLSEGVAPPHDLSVEGAAGSRPSPPGGAANGGGDRDE